MTTWTAIIIKSDKYRTPYPLSAAIGDDEFSEIEASSKEEAERYVLEFAPKWAKEALKRGDMILTEKE